MFRSINKMYYRGVNGVMLVCDLQSLESFKKLDSWLSDFLEQQDRTSDYSEFAFILLANKSDMEKELRKVTEEDLDKWCHQQKQ